MRQERGRRMARRQAGGRVRIGLANRIHARLAALSGGMPELTRPPEPRDIGSVPRGRELARGRFRMAGHMIDSDPERIWDQPPPDRYFAHELHGFAWLDDLAAAADGAARAAAARAVMAWIARFGRGSGPGWTPAVTGRRVMRWIDHSAMILDGASSDQSAAFRRSLAQQTVFLSRRARSAPAGLPRLTALCGLIHAGLSLRGMDRHVARAADAVGQECARRIDAEGGIASRNPEELLNAFALLTRAAADLREAGFTPAAPHLSAIERIAPTLRALRHADGGLARFHGGGRGAEGRLDLALSLAGGRAVTARGLAMGYARLAAGRSTVIVDAARPPIGPHSVNAHASTLALELTSGRRPLIVNCGSGARFGADWRRAARATAAHSTLAIEGYSSSRLAAGARAELAEIPDQVWAQPESDPQGQTLTTGHNGYVPTHGLTHVRTLVLARDGRTLTGEDTLGAMSVADRRRFETVMERMGHRGVPFALHFHLHPDVEAAPDASGLRVMLRLKSGESWIFSHDGTAEMSLRPSVYLDEGLPEPRPCRQIVLSATLQDYAMTLGWTLAKSQDTPTAIRDILRDDDPDTFA